MPDRVTLAGVALCSPYEQGDLDNLCGVYAALNAICLVAAPTNPLSRAQAQVVFQAGIADLVRRDGLEETIENGMQRRRQQAVTRRMVAKAAVLTGMRLVARRVFASASKPSCEDIVGAMRSRLAAGSPLIIELRGVHNHYSVVAGLTPGRLRLFDSDGLKWIARRSLGVSTTDMSARHLIPPTSVVEITTR